MTRVTHLITGLSEGGAELALSRLLRALDRRRFECEVVSLRGDGPVAAQIRDAGIPVTALGLRPGSPTVRGLWNLTAHLLRRPPDLLQTWLYHADLAGTLAGALARVRRVAWNVRASDMDTSRYSKMSALTIRACARLSAWPAAVVTNSQAAIDHHTRLGYRPRQWVLIPNGIDTAVFAPDAGARRALRTELGLPGSARLVGCIARHDPMKDHDTFFAAARRIAERQPDVHFVLAGAGVTSGNTAFGPATTQGLLAGRVHLLGSRRDMPRLMAALDVAVSSSAFGEGFSNALAEAMSCGVPCVATRVGDAERLIGRPEHVVPRRDAAALAAAIDGVLRLDQAAAGALGEAARARIRAHFDLSAMVARYEALYDALLEQKSCAA